MRPYHIPSSLLCLFAIISRHPRSASATPAPSEDHFPSLEDRQIVGRDGCSNPCGYDDWLCCGGDTICTTILALDQASCMTTATAANNAQYQIYVTTFTTTNLQVVTRTTSSLVAVTTVPSCVYSQGESLCGNCCCVNGETCSNGVCISTGGGSSGNSYYTTLTTTVNTGVNTGSSPLLPTSGNPTTTITSTASVLTAVSSSGATLVPSPSSSSGGLSGAAIAGIVIGVIAGIIILLLICACCCAKGLIDGILGIFGLGPRRRRRREDTYIEERHSHRSGRGDRTWFGSRPARGSRTSVVEKRTSGGFGGLAGVTAALGGLALILGLKRRRGRRDDKSETDYSSSYYDSEYTSRSSESSDRRTRDSRRSRSRR